MSANATRWWEAEEGQKHTAVFDYVSEVERTQVDVFDRFIKLAALYDPNDPAVIRGGWWPKGVGSMSADTNMAENVVASAVDTVHAQISASEVSPRIQTDDADWSMQRRARHLQWYAEGLMKLLGINELAPDVFKDAAIKGDGLLYVYADHELKKICVERVLVDDIIVDDTECRAGKPRQMARRMFVDRDELIARFPDFEEEIERAKNKIGSLMVRETSPRRCLTGCAGRGASGRPPGP